jgi:rare lipoprotein A
MGEPFPNIDGVLMTMLKLGLAATMIGLLTTLPSAAETGIASVYGSRGGKTANGEQVYPSKLTAAHRTLPFGTMVTVTNRKNGQSVTVRINDRGPFIRGRIIDLTPAGARALQFSGLAPVTVVRQ